MTSSDRVVDGETYVIRPTDRQRFAHAIGEGAVWAIFAVVVLWSNWTGALSTGFRWLLLAEAVIIAAAYVVGLRRWWRRDRRLELRTDGIRVVERRAERLIPWTSIRVIKQGSALGVRTVRLITDRGFIGLRVPYTSVGPSADPTFEHKADTIREWWIAYRGPDFDRPPPPSEDPLR